MHTALAVATSVPLGGHPHDAAWYRNEVSHQVEALVEQETNYDVALAVHGKGRSMLLQLVSYLVVSLAVGYQLDLGSSTSQLAIITVVIVGYMVSDIITSALVSLLQMDAFNRPHMAVFVQFCFNTPLTFVGYVAVNIIRDNVIASDTALRLESIIPVSVLLSFVYVDMLYGDAKNDQIQQVYQELRQRSRRAASTAVETAMP